MSKREIFIDTNASEEEMAYELPQDVDFSNAVSFKERYAQKLTVKKQVSMRLDGDTLADLKRIAEYKRIGYQTIINSVLRDYVREELSHIS